MNNLWTPLDIPDFAKVQEELAKMVLIESGVTKTYAFSVDERVMIEQCPTLMNWLTPRKKRSVRIYRFYITEPYGCLGAHIDGSKELKVPFGMNIPVANCKNTHHIFYDCDEDNIRNEFKNGYLAGCVPIDHSLLKEKTRLEITTPYFTRNDVVHSVENNNPTYRIMFTVRWLVNSKIGRDINEVFDFGI